MHQNQNVAVDAFCQQSKDKKEISQGNPCLVVQINGSLYH